MPAVYKHMPVPPPSNLDTTCRHAQMSKWRQKGFVQDSDEEEEESQLESQGSKPNGGLDGRVERVEDDIDQTEQTKQTEEARGQLHKVEGCLGGDGGSGGYVKRPGSQEKSIATPTKRRSPKRPSPFTPKSAHNPRSQPSESPDPLQCSQSPRSQRTIRPLSPQQRLESPTHPHSSTVSIPQLNQVEPAFQTVWSSKTTTWVTPREKKHEITRTSNILNEFGIVPLSDNSDDDELSDPPTDLESPPPYFVEPHRKTAVQVVITSSNALQQQLVQERMQERGGRDFRQRKPIQMHPYLLENEEYKRTVQSRGLQPVGRARSRSPQGHSRQKDNETQEQEFNPDEDPTSSPPDAEIPVSSPVVPQPGKDGHPADSARRPASKHMRRPASTQLRHPHSTKRRKLNISSTQATMPSTGPPTSIFDNPVMHHDIWLIPPNSPPHSSSPPLHRSASVRRPGVLRRMTPAPDLPTPSTSSVMQDDPHLGSDSNSDTAPRSTQRPDSGLRRPKRVVLTDSSSSADGSASEAEQSDNELRNVSRKMKGVLPASWLRFDQQNQKQHKAQAREREKMSANVALSPGRAAPVRGVAQKITRPSGRPTLSSAFNTHTRDTVVISDDSEADKSVPASLIIPGIQDSVADASALAQKLDDRYIDNDNLSDMEHDRLPLPTLGEIGSRRKKQSRFPDTFGNAKKAKSSDGTGKRSAYKKWPSNNLTEKKKQSHFGRSRRVSPPAMSVVDVVLSPSERTASVPQFLRVARRQALRRPDLARQSPRNKQIRLHNAEDTEEANKTLQQWRQGSLKPKLNGAVKERTSRPSMVDRINNKHSAERQSMTDAGSVKDLDGQSEAATEVSRIRPRRNIPLGLQNFQRLSPRSTRQGKNPSQASKFRKRPEYMGPLPFRTAQLEGDESAFGREHRKIAFEKALLRVDQQFGKQLSEEYHVANPQLVRYLADDCEKPPLPPADHVGEHATEAPSEIGPTTKRRLKRKAQARRVDVETRKFRQPSEPAVQEIIGTISLPQVQELATEQTFPVLHGLGPYGTRYPITFDIYSVASETYFHSSTLIGSDEFHRALNIGKPEGRDLDETAGFFTITCETTSVRCGPWNDETSSTLYDLARNSAALTVSETSSPDTSARTSASQVRSARLARSLIVYISDHLSFLDPIDRRDCVNKSTRLCQTLFDGAMAAFDSTCGHGAGHDWTAMRTMSYLLVISLQLYRIAQHPHVDENCRAETLLLIKNAAKTVVTHLVRQAGPELGNFLELNKRHAVREKGVQDSEITIESTVVCIHVLEELRMSGWGFWDLLSQELSPKVSSATHISVFETIWARLFTFLPFSEIDASGIPLRNRRETFRDDNWTCIRDILRRIFELYTSTRGKHSASLNDYVRANLARCHRLMTHWHWRRPELMLNAVIDFFGKHGLKGLRHEASVGSITFLDDLNNDCLMTVEPNEYSFHTALKCLALGLRGMKDIYPEKKMRSFVFRSVPNHGRAHPKDQPLDEGNLAALRNHHDLLSTLYWNAPPGCRPKLEQIKGLVNHESSHREACRLSVRAWTNLTTFQLSTKEPYASAEPFALWHKDIMHQTLRQYKLAKVEAEDFLKSVAVDGATNISVVMVRQTMEKNQGQVIATLRDCIAGISKAIRHTKDLSSLKKFLVASDIMHLLELPHLEDRRLIGVIHDTLKVLQEYSKVQQTQHRKEGSQQISEESQDYGDFPDMDDLDDLDQPVPAKQAQQSDLDFIQTPLWHLLSNAFGAENAPDDILLKDCIDTWVCIAGGQVASGVRSWSYYLDSFSHMSWKQLRQTEQTRKFGPYFLAALIDCDRAVYEEHRNGFLQALMVCLVERESMLRFQHQLLHAIMRTDGRHPLMRNLPFFRDLQTGAWDINPDSLRTRRLGLISSILSNMRDDFYAISRHEPARAAEAKRVYVCMLRDFMESMKHNYQKLSQGTTIIGAYVEFVQKIVRFLKQYTSDILPVSPFFTDSAAFPLPAEDPTYVVARLCGYAPKLSDSGTAKQLSVFIQTVAQQAAADNQQVYLVHQLTSALCMDESPAADRVALRSALLQAIFPAYIEEAFSSRTAFTIGRPILQALPSIIDTMIFDLRVTQSDNVASITNCIVSVSHAFISGTEQLKDNYHELFQRPYVFSALAHMLDAMTSILTLLEYICSRTLPTIDAPPLATYMDQFITYITTLLHNTAPDTIPSYPDDSHAPPSDTQHANLLAFCHRSLKETLSTNWSESAGAIWFGVGNARREILPDTGTVEEERLVFEDGVRRFQCLFDDLYGLERYHGRHEDDMGLDDVVV